MDASERLQIRIVGPSGKKNIPLRPSTMTIGRGSQSDILIVSSEVSRHHATLHIHPSGVQITDENSKNGTFLNGERLPAKTPVPWPMGQVLRLGLAPEQINLVEITKEDNVEEGSYQTGSVTRGEGIRSTTMVTQSEIHVPPAIPTATEMEQKMQSMVAQAESESQSLRQGAQEQASLQLKLQNLQGEVERLTQARDQLSQQLNQEVKELEAQIAGLKSRLSQELESSRARAQQEARELVEKAQQQAQQILVEAEQKVRGSQQKQNVGLSSASTPSWPTASPVSSSSPPLVKPKFTPPPKEELASEAETRIIQRPQQRPPPPPGPPSAIAGQAQFSREKKEFPQTKVSGDETMVGFVLSEAESEDLPSHLLQHKKMRLGLGLVAASVILILAVGMWRTDRGNVNSGKAQMASSAAETQPVGPSKAIQPAPPVQEIKPDVKPTEASSAPLPPSSPPPAPVATTTQPAAPVAAVTSTVQPESFAKEEPSSSQQLAESVAVTAAAAHMVPAKPVPIVTKAVRYHKNKNKAVQTEVAKKPLVKASGVRTKSLSLVQTVSSPPASNWMTTLSGSQALKWRKISSRYLIESLKVDRRKVSRYQQLEVRFVGQINLLRGPASERQRKKQEAQFVADSKSLLGEDVWKKLLIFRDYFIKKNKDTKNTES